MGQSQTLELLIKAKGDFDSTFSQLLAGMKKVDEQAKAQGSSFGELRKGLDSFVTGNAESFRALGQGLALAGGAVAAVGAAIIALGSRGADVADVREQFGILNDAIGNSADVIVKLRVALGNTVTDFDIMKTVNTGLSAGLKLTAADMELVGKASRVLADRVGGDTKKAFDDLIMGMTKGKDGALSFLGVNVDLAQAQETYAANIGKSVSQLNEAQQLEAKRNAVLDDLRLKLAQSGEAQVDFADRVQIGKVAIENFTNALGEVISQSPVINKAMEVVSNAVLDAFGENQAATIETLIGWVNNFAIGVVKAASAAVTVAHTIADAWQGLKVMFNAVVEGLVGALSLFVKGAAMVAQAQMVMMPGGKTIFGGMKKQLDEDAAALEHLSKGFKEQKEAALDSAGTQNAAFLKVQGFLGNLTKEMEKATSTTQKLGVSHVKTGKDTETHGATITKTLKAVEDWRKKVFELDAILKLAQKNFTPLDDVIKQHGRSIEEAARLGQEFGEKLPAAVQRVADAMHTAKLDELMKKVANGVRRAVDDIKKDMDDAAKKVFEANTKLLIEREEEAGRKAVEGQRAAAQAAEEHRRGIIDLANAFGNLGATVGGTFGGMLQQGAELVDMYMNAGQAVTKLQKAAAAVQAVQSAYAGGSVLGGAAKGAAVGSSILPGWGTAIGAVVGGVAGYFGGKAKEKAAANEAARLRDEFIKLSGGIDGVNKIARELGVNMETWLGSNTPAVMASSIRRMNEAMADQQKRVQAVQAAMGGLELRTKGFADQMAKGGEASERTQAAFDRLGTYALVTFGAFVRETGDAIGALQQMGTSLDQLVALQSEFGFGASAAVTSLLGMRDIVTANADVADSLSGLNQLMKSLGEAGYQNAALFQAFGADAADLFGTLIERGVNANQAMALMQPTLQSLWEHQQRFKDITDEATLALLEEAEQQGIVGANMRDVNEQILEVLLAIGEVLGATIPAALERTSEAAKGAFGEMESGAKRAAEWMREWLGSSGGGNAGPTGPPAGAPNVGNLPGFALGGTVPWTPGGRLVRVAEQGTEHILTSAQLAEIIGRAGAMNGGSNQGGGQMINLTVPIYIGAQQLDEVINKRIAAGYIGRPE